MKPYLIIILWVFSVSSCSNRDKLQQNISIDKLLPYVPKDASSLYYPLDSLFFVSDSSNRHGDSMIKAMDSEILFNLKEPILYASPFAAIRLLWIRPFDNPVIVRLNKFQDTVYANIKELKNASTGDNSYIPRISMDTMIMLNSKEWKGILFSMEQNKFWNAMTADTSNGYKDGTFWILECRIDNKYHFIERAYIDSTSFRDCEYVKKIFDIGSRVISLNNTRE